MNKSNVAWVIKSGGGVLKVTFTNGWPWVKDTPNGKLLTDGSSGNINGYLKLEPTDGVILLHQGGEFIPTGPVLGEVKIGR